jgi:hypothetical protein
MQGYRNSDIGLTATPTRTDMLSERSLTATRGLQRLERSVAVKGAAAHELDLRTRRPDALVLDVLFHPRPLRWRQMAKDNGPGRGFASRKNGHWYLLKHGRSMGGGLGGFG